MDYGDKDPHVTQFRRSVKSPQFGFLTINCNVTQFTTYCFFFLASLFIKTTYSLTYI